ncbi:MAG: hypothetical protein PF545_00355 [Elusimicrobia bacterium]|jgi:hypothetical protein|nr:hypothetical protein [Elusimicrobiota bacterium]
MRFPVIKYIAAFMLLFTAACAPVSFDIPSKDLTGVMYISINSRDYLNGIFEVQGEKEEFVIYLYSPASDPIGSIAVKKRRIIKNSTGFENEFIDIFKYWPYIFGWGKRKGEETQKIRGGRIVYDNFKGENPERVKVSLNDTEIDISINYGNKDTGKD